MIRFILLVGLLIAPQARAQDSVIAEIREVWASCNTLLERTDWKRDDWTGWRRDFGNGYGDYFQFWDGRGEEVSVLRRQFFIDGAASEFQTSCFRPDGTLAFVLIEGTAANVYRDPASAPQYVTREGRFYLSRDGSIIYKTGQIAMDGKRVGDFNSRQYQPGRTCQSLDLHLTLERVRQHGTSQLGDIYGKRPDYKPNEYNWCGALEAR